MQCTLWRATCAHGSGTTLIDRERGYETFYFVLYPPPDPSLVCAPLLSRPCHPNAVEQGGEDLFEFFDQHLEGVDQRTAQEIILGITLPIAYLHNLHICHRDLKPENILLKQIPGQPIQSSMIQICDFGLCCQKVRPNTKSLSEFCGSPGFFAPEMVLGGGKYNGLLVDVWSIGCIMLELSLGHDIFCKSWMSAYDFDIIQRPSAFEDAIENAVSRLNLGCMSVEMADFVKQVLVIDPSQRGETL